MKMSMTAESRRLLFEMQAAARDLANTGRFVEAREAFLVAADASEERGSASFARWLRTQARRMEVIVWAREALASDIDGSNVIPSDDSGRGEVRQFEISYPMGQVPSFLPRTARVRVSIDRRGRVRILRHR